MLLADPPAPSGGKLAHRNPSPRRLPAGESPVVNHIRAAGGAALLKQVKLAAKQPRGRSASRAPLSKASVLSSPSLDHAAAQYLIQLARRRQPAKLLGIYRYQAASHRQPGGAFIPDRQALTSILAAFSFILTALSSVSYKRIYHKNVLINRRARQRREKPSPRPLLMRGRLKGKARNLEALRPSGRFRDEPKGLFARATVQAVIAGGNVAIFSDSDLFVFQQHQYSTTTPSKSKNPSVF